MKILITGVAGFIGFHLARKLLTRGDTVVGLDNINDYYISALKFARLECLGINGKCAEDGREPVSSDLFPNFTFCKADIIDRETLDEIFTCEEFDCVCNLAAQAGVRYSIDNPDSYIRSNIVGFYNVLECCRRHNVRNLVYASSSSVYGANTKTPFSETDRTDCPKSLYAATKKSDELMAYSYSDLFGLRTTGLRYFTVYGAWGRPDMSPILFANAITSGKPIRLFNGGDMVRDFTYIDDIVEGTVLAIDNPPAADEPSRIFNIGCSNPVKLPDFIAALEQSLGQKAEFEILPMQPGDVPVTFADTSRAVSVLGYSPKTTISQGVAEFAKWYKRHRELVLR